MLKIKLNENELKYIVNEDFEVETHLGILKGSIKIKASQQDKLVAMSKNKNATFKDSLEILNEIMEIENTIGISDEEFDVAKFQIFKELTPALEKKITPSKRK